MKISKRQLRRIIKEEKARILTEQTGGDYDEGVRYADDNDLRRLDTAMNDVYETIFLEYSDIKGDKDRAIHLAKTVLLGALERVVKDFENNFEERFGSWTSWRPSRK